MSLLFSLLMKMDAGQAKTELRALQTEMTKAGGAAKVLGDGAKGAGTGIDVLGAKAGQAEAKLEAVAAAQTRVAATAGQMQRSTQAASGSMGNLVAQFNDVGMMIMAGQNPLQLAIQQGTQITQVIGPMGASGAVKALGGALMSMLSPINLVTLGVIGFGAAAIQWLSGAEEKSQTLAAALDRVAASLSDTSELAKIAAGDFGSLLSAYGQLTPEIMNLVAAQKQISLRELSDAAKDLNSQLLALYDGNAWMNVSRAEELANALDLGTYSSNFFATALNDLSRAGTLDDQLSQVKAIREEFVAAVGPTGQMTAAQFEFYQALVESEAALQRVKERTAELSATTVTTVEAAAAFAPVLAAADDATGGIASRLREAASAAGMLEGSNIAGMIRAALGPAASLSRILQTAAGWFGSMSGGGIKIRGTASSGIPAAPPTLGYSSTASNPINLGMNIGGAGAGSGGGAAKAEADAVADLITKLREEQEVLAETDPVKQELLKYRKQLADATAAERAEVESLIRAEQQLKAIREAEDFASKSAADFLDAIIVKGESAEDALKSLLSSLIKVGIQALMLGEGPLAGILGIKGGLFSGLFGNLGAKALASGGDAAPARLAGRKAIRAGDVAGFADAARRRPIRGLITGDGGPRDDRVPAWLSPGEYIVNGRATARYRPVLERMNAGADIAGYASGGMVGATRGAGIGGFGGRGRPPVGDIHIHGAQGDAQIREMVAQGIKVGLTAYDRDVLPSRVPGILRDPRAR